MLRQVRESQALTQAEAGELMGIYPGAVCEIEHGRRHLRLAEFARLAVALQLPDSEIAALVRSAADDAAPARSAA